MQRLFLTILVLRFSRATKAASGIGSEVVIIVIRKIENRSLQFEMSPFEKLRSLKHTMPIAVKVSGEINFTRLLMDKLNDILRLDIECQSDLVVHPDLGIIKRALVLGIEMLALSGKLLRVALY